MIATTNLVANRWYRPGDTEPRLPSPYPSPQSIMRSAVGALEYHWRAEGAQPAHIRAAAIFDPDAHYHELLNEPWSMVYYRGTYVMVIVSTADPLRWILQAQQRGALAWLRGHQMTVTYNWEPPMFDSQGNRLEYSSDGELKIQDGRRGPRRRKYGKT